MGQEREGDGRGRMVLLFEGMREVIEWWMRWLL